MDAARREICGRAASVGCCPAFVYIWTGSGAANGQRPVLTILLLGRLIEGSFGQTVGELQFRFRKAWATEGDGLGKVGAF
ncbi:MAG: hypothetical protein ACOYI4_07670 [Christensenellales bacterium]